MSTPMILLPLERYSSRRIEAPSRSDGDAHHGPLRAAVEEFPALARPERLGAACRGHLPLATCHVRERPHVHLEAAGSVRLLREPSAVGRDLRVELTERR